VDYLVVAVGSEGWGDFEKMQSAERLLARARAIAPDSEVVLNTYVAAELTTSLHVDWVAQVRVIAIAEHFLT
jgi:hypothetical protein